MSSCRPSRTRSRSPPAPWPALPPVAVQRHVSEAAGYGTGAAAGPCRDARGVRHLRDPQVDSLGDLALQQHAARPADGLLPRHAHYSPGCMPLTGARVCMDAPTQDLLWTVQCDKHRTPGTCWATMVRAAARAGQTMQEARGQATAEAAMKQHPACAGGSPACCCSSPMSHAAVFAPPTMKMLFSPAPSAARRASTHGVAPGRFEHVHKACALVARR